MQRYTAQNSKYKYARSGVGQCASRLNKADSAAISGNAIDSRIVSGMSVDVEDYYQVSAFEPYIKRSDWHRYPSRVQSNVYRILDSMAARDVKATFFTLGCVAERYPELVRRIVAEGHEVASHGWHHKRVTDQTPGEFGIDVKRAKALLEDISGVRVTGYRAPSYSITGKSLWAHELLAEAGYLYSSSIVPITHDHYGIPDAPRFAFKAGASGLIEIPVSTVNINGMNYPCGGGGWFRLYPYLLSRLALENVIQKDSMPCVFYFHPWEIDPEQPRIRGLDAKTRFRHYVHLSKMEGKINKLLEGFRWGRMDEVFLPQSDNLQVNLLV